MSKEAPKVETIKKYSFSKKELQDKLATVEGQINELTRQFNHLGQLRDEAGAKIVGLKGQHDLLKEMATSLEE